MAQYYSVPETSIKTSISSIGPPVAGYNYTLICTVTLTEGLLDIPTVWWVDRDDQLITPTEDVILYDPLTSGLTTYLTLYFDPIRTRDKGTYICMASVSSPAVSSALNSSALYTVDVQLSKDLLQ